MTIIERIKKIEELEKIEIPWTVKRSGVNPTIFGTQVCLSDAEYSDFLTVDEAREVAEYLVTQLNGKVKWNR